MDGIPIYLYSDIFSIKEFKEIKEKGNEILLKNSELVEKGYSENELVKYCSSQRLVPNPEWIIPTRWRANCVKEPKHRMLLLLDSNEWFCGYCHIGGNLEELKELIESKKNKF